MCYGAPMDVADLIEKLKSFPQDLPVVGTYDGNCGDPDPAIVEAGEVCDGVTFKDRTVVI